MHDDDGSGSIDDRPLSPMQAGMLFQALLDPRGGFDIEQLVVRLREPIDDAALREGWRAAARTHEALRSSFRFSGLEHPVQRTQATFEPDLVQHDWASATEAESEARLAALLESDRQRGFDLERPAWRVHVCRLGPQRVDMVWSIHHMLVDGASFATVLSEVLEVHGAVLAGRAPPQHRRTRPSADAARVPPGGATSDLERNFWRALLEGKLAPTPLPFSEPASNPLPDRGTGEVTVSLDERTTADLHALAIACDQPMAAVVHALWALFLSRWSGDHDVLFGSTPTTRPVGADADADAHDMVGMFINSLPMRVALAEEGTVRELVGELGRQGRSLREHASASLVEVTSASALPRGVPLFETVVDFDNEDLNETLARHDPTWRTRQVSVLEQPAATLVLTVFDGQRLKLRLLHQRRRVRDTVAARIVRHLERLAHHLARGPDQKLGAIDSLPDDERQRILVEWNDTERPFPSELGIHQGFEAQVDRQPTAVAVVQGARTMSYCELEEASNRLAHLLRQHGAAPGTWVGLCMERTPELVTALLGIAKSGAAYVPLDPDHPAERTAFMVEDSGVELIVTERALRARLGDVTCLELDGVDRDALAAMPSTRPAPVGSPADPCYAIYTSGSSGRPKGVVLSHRAVVNTFDWVSRTFQVRPGDRLLFVTSPSFDLSVYDTFGVLAAGATLEVASAALLRDPGALVARLVDGEITIWDSAPQALQQLTPFLPERAERSRLRLVMLSGDWIPLALPPALQRVFPQVEVHSLGGATEAAIWSNWFPVGAIDPRWTSVPYGRPLQNVRYHVLDAHMRPAPIGVPGDLYIGGACLAEGYRNRPELTVERFVPDPFREQERDGRPARLYQTGDRARYLDDGNLEFLGRADFQVKVRGFRVELGEIEFVLGQERDVSEAVCVARRDPAGGNAVWAYVTLRAQATLDALSAPAALRQALATRLPDYMVPAGIVVLDKMPLSSNGKLDRAALPDPALVGRTGEVTTPTTPLERRLVNLWVELLQRRPVGIEDNFFELGGHSLLAVLLISRIKRELGIEVPLSRVLERPTIASFAKGLGEHAAGPTTHLVTLREGGTQPPLVLVPGIGGQIFNFRPLAQRLGPDHPVHGFTAIGLEPGDPPRESIEEIARVYADELAASTVKGPLILGGFSLGALVAFELACQLVARGTRVAALVFFDALAPGYPKKLPATERLHLHVAELRRRHGSERRDYLLERLNNLGRSAAFKVGLGHLVAPRIEQADDALDLGMRRLWAKMCFERDSYQPLHRFDGPLLLFATEGGFNWPATRLDDRAYGWGSYVSGLINIVPIQGTHVQVFDPANLETLATAIGELGERLRSAGGAP